MTASSKRQDAGQAVAGLFARSSTTGGLAGRHETRRAARESTEELSSNHGRRENISADADAASPYGNDSSTASGVGEARVRLGVELTERESAFLRALSRPSRTGGPRTLGGKFVATGVLAAAIELLEYAEIDMHGVVAGDLDEMKARARDALVRSGARELKEANRED
jgi:hypothetical protein